MNNVANAGPSISFEFFPPRTDEGERQLCEYAMKKAGSEFVFVTHYPRDARPFYTMPDPDDPEKTLGFDLLFRGEFPAACAALAPLQGDAEAFIRAFWRKNRPNGRDFTVMMLLAMAASYDPDPDQPGRIRLPFDMASLSDFSSVPAVEKISRPSFFAIWMAA